jgi:hypothetical protein
MSINDEDSVERKVYRFIRNQKGKLTPEHLKELEALGMIPKDQLENGGYYYGVCRNTNVAWWRGEADCPSDTVPGETIFPNDAKGPCFWYLRLKINKVRAEDINHPEDDEGQWDLFIPLKKIGQSEY